MWDMKRYRDIHNNHYRCSGLTFVPQKGRIYPLSKDEREEVQNFVEDQLKKGYIRPTKSVAAEQPWFTAGH